MDYIKKTSTLAALFFIWFLLFALAVPGKGFSDFLLLISAAASVIFGIYIAFTISNSRERLNKTNELLKIEDANLLLLFKLSKVFDQKKQDEILKLLDKYLVEQIDYKLEDFALSAPSFHKLHDYILHLDCKNNKQERVHDEMISVLSSSSTNRTQVETIVHENLSKLEWISVCSLTFIFISLVWQMTYSGMGIFYLLLTDVLASTSLLLLLVARDINALKWQKDTWTWKPLNSLFKSMGLIPYYPRIVVTSGEVILPVGEKVRFAEYPNPYPDMNGKEVRIVEISQDEMFNQEYRYESIDPQDLRHQ